MVWCLCYKKVYNNQLLREPPLRTAPCRLQMAAVAQCAAPGGGAAALSSYLESIWAVLLKDTQHFCRRIILFRGAGLKSQLFFFFFFKQMGKVSSRFVMSNGSSHAKLEINSTEVLLMLRQSCFLSTSCCETACASCVHPLREDYKARTRGGAGIGMKQNANNNNADCLQFHLLISIDIYTGTGSTCNKPRPSWFYSSPECGLVWWAVISLWFHNCEWCEIITQHQETYDWLSTPEKNWVTPKIHMQVLKITLKNRYDVNPSSCMASITYNTKLICCVSWSNATMKSNLPVCPDTSSRLLPIRLLPLLQSPISS